MKQFLLLLIIIVTGCAMHHRLPVPAAQFQYVDTKINPYVKMLHLKDSNSLILRVSYRYDSSHTGDFLVKDSNGNLTYCTIMLGPGINDTVIYNRKLKKDEAKKITTIFNETIAIDQESLDINNDSLIYDAGGLELDVYQGRYFTKVKSYFDSYYKDKPIALEELKKMGKIASEINREKLVEAKSYRDIEKLDTVYVYFNYDKLQAKSPPGNKYRKMYDFYLETYSYHTFMHIENDSMMVKKSFLEKHRDNTIDHIFFLKNPMDSFSLKHKTVILIDDNGKNIYLKKVRHAHIHMRTD